MNLYWLEQAESDVPAGTDWLGPGEAFRLESMRFPKRRADWLLGRWTAKRALAACLGGPCPLSHIEIRTAPSGAPKAFFDNRPAGLDISLSHRDGIACCALARSPTALGCDLELIEPRSAGFVADYFTAEEQASVARAAPVGRPLLVTLLWSAKESVLKARGTGLREDTRSVEVTAEISPGGAWHLFLAGHSGTELYGWWRSDGRLVRTVVDGSMDPDRDLVRCLPIQIRGIGVPSAA